MTPEKLARLAFLQQGAAYRMLNKETALELESLRTELAREQQETADDPHTLFTDESRRPLLDGADWNEHNRTMACDEVLNFLKLLFAKYGVPLGEAALQAGIAALKRRNA